MAWFWILVVNDEVQSGSDRIHKLDAERVHPQEKKIAASHEQRRYQKKHLTGEARLSPTPRDWCRR